MHCHHEKTIVIDDRVAFVGGIDLTSEAGDRFDTNEHPPRSQVGWHDASARIEGPAVGDVAEHFRMRWHEVSRRTAARRSSRRACRRDASCRSCAPFRSASTTPCRAATFGILESYLRALRAARTVRVHREPVSLVARDRARSRRQAHEPTTSPTSGSCCVLPAKPNSGADDTRGVLGELIEADADAGRLLACTLYARSGALADHVYVHAKIAIVDDAWLTIGSANLNEHSLFNDTEMNIVLHDPDLATSTRRRLWAEHLELSDEQLPADPIVAIDELWKPISKEQLDRRLSGRPLTHRLARLPHVSRRSSRAFGPVSGLLVDG